MSKRKPLSADEKRTKLLELFHETGDVFQLKDLERIAPTQKGIVLQSVKTVLEELVNSGEVQSKKIAGSLYYWAFTSNVLNNVRQQLERSEALSAQLQEQIAQGRQRLQEAAALSADSGEAAAVENEIAELRAELSLLEKRAKVADITAYENISAKEHDAQVILQAANRWTDNIFAIKMWCKQKFNKEDRELDKGFGIPDDLDYLDD